jgi:tetratricopeptide (TPR) repeat protein
MSQNAPAIFQEAVQLCKDEKFDDAIQLIDTLLQYQPQHRLGLFVRGAIRIQNQQVREAMMDWEAAFDGTDRQAAQRVQQQYPELVEVALNHFAFETTVDPNDAVRHAAYGKAARFFDKFEQAQRHLSRAFEIDKYCWKEAILAAELHRALGDSEAALQLLQKLQELHPENAEIQYSSALFYQHSNSTAFALRHLEKAVALEPGHSDARYALGAIYVQQGRSDQAIAQLYAAIKIKPTAASHCRLAEAHQQLYQFDESLNHYRLAAELEPDNFKLLCDLGALALQFGDLQLGISSLKKAVTIDPKNPDVYAHLAKAAVQSGDLVEATSSYQKLLDLQPDDVFALRSLASIHLTQQNPAVAIPLLTRAKNLNASDVQVWIDLARAYRLSDNLVSSKQTLREALELYPNNLALQQESLFDPSSSEPEAKPQMAPARELTYEELYNLGRAARDAGNSDEALKSFSQALALLPSEPDCLEAVALLYRDKGLLAPAADFMRQSYVLVPDRQDRLETFVNLLDQLMDFEQDELLDEFFQSSSVEASDILQRIEQLSGPGAEAIRKRYQPVAESPESSHPAEPVNSPPVEASNEETPLQSHPDQSTQGPAAQQPLPVEAVEVTSPEETDFDGYLEPGRESSPPPIEQPKEEPVSHDLADVQSTHNTELLEPDSNLVFGPPSLPTDSTEESPAAKESLAQRIKSHTASVPSLVQPTELNAIVSESDSHADGIQPSPIQSTEPRSIENSASTPLTSSSQLLELETTVAELQAALSTANSKILEQQQIIETLQAEFQGRETSLSERDGALIEREQKLALLEQQLQSQILQFQWQTEESAERDRQLSQKLEELTLKESGLQTSMTACEERESGLKQNEEKLQQREVLLREQEEALRSREEALKLAEEQMAIRASAIVAPIVSPVVATESAITQSEPESIKPVIEPLATAVTVSGVVAQVVTIPSLSSETIASANETKSEVIAPQPEVELANLASEPSSPSDLAALSLLLDKDPEYPNSVDLAWKLANENESDFLALFRELSRPSNADPRHSRNFALAYLHRQRPLLAVVQLQKYLQKLPNPAGYRLLADVYQRMNRQSNVDDCIRRAEALEAQG